IACTRRAMRSPCRDRAEIRFSCWWPERRKWLARARGGIGFSASWAGARSSARFPCSPQPRPPPQSPYATPRRWSRSSPILSNPSEVSTIRRDHLNALAKPPPPVPNGLAEFAQQRMARNLIATSPVLQQIPEADRTAVLRRFAFRALQSWETALTEGQHSPGVF